MVEHDLSVHRFSVCSYIWNCTLVSKPVYCQNLSSFDIPREELLELIEDNDCLAPPGQKIPGKSLSSLIREDFLIGQVEWSKFDISNVFKFGGLKLSEEIRFVLGLAVAVLAGIDVRKDSERRKR